MNGKKIPNSQFSAAKKVKIQKNLKNRYFFLENGMEKLENSNIFFRKNEIILLTQEIEKLFNGFLEKSKRNSNLCD